MSGRGAVYPIGPFNHTASLHEELSSSIAWAPRLLGSSDLGPSPRFGASLDIEPSSGLMLVGAPYATTRNGPASGAVIRSWLLRSTVFPLDEEYEGSALAALNAARAAESPLDFIAERHLWGADSRPADHFGEAIALSSAGYAVVGAPSHAAGGMLLSGGAYVFGPNVASPSAPPSSPPAPSFPPSFPPTRPPSSPRDDTMVIVVASTIAGGSLALIVMGSIITCAVLSYLARKAARLRQERARARFQKAKAGIKSLMKAHKGEKGGLADIATLAKLGTGMGKTNAQSLSSMVKAAKQRGEVHGALRGEGDLARSKGPGERKGSRAGEPMELMDLIAEGNEPSSSGAPPTSLTGIVENQLATLQRELADRENELRAMQFANEKFMAARQKALAVTALSEVAGGTLDADVERTDGSVEGGSQRGRVRGREAGPGWTKVVPL